MQITEQPENKNELSDILAFYQPHKLNQISVNKMFVTTEEGIQHIGVKQNSEYIVGTCQSYGGSYLVQTNGSVLGCCGQFYFYPKLKDKIPNLFEKSLEECKKISDELYLNNPIFIDYCKQCSLYVVNNKDYLERKFIFNGYFAMQYSSSTKYFVIPEALRQIPDDVLLFMYEKGFVSEIKRFIQDKG
ncbi:hypothetical protein [Helicobacter monodelphidis]|uniref:hypothetical protein n=1 Tax=Helicobacter sp. 15-1451 TaxID=2004995 RepID=UPI0011BF3D16|nr:hypothetical protein [Helicobacter sp. 15-1451]